jgi:hypothetical protein
MCVVLLPPGVNPTAVSKYIISYYITFFFDVTSGNLNTYLHGNLKSHEEKRFLIKPKSKNQALGTFFLNHLQKAGIDFDVYGDANSEPSGIVDFYFAFCFISLFDARALLSASHL